MIEDVGAHCLCKVVDIFKVLFFKETAVDQALFLQNVLNVQHTGVGKGHAAAFFVKRVVADNLFPFQLIGILAGFGIFLNLFKLIDELIDIEIPLGVVFGSAGDDERSTRLVDEDGVYFVHNREGKAALHFFFYCKLHIVAQIVKTEFVIGTVGNVRIVSSFPRGVVHV